MEDIDHKLKRWRVARGMKPVDVAKRIKCKRQTVFRYEAGRMPDQPFLDRIVVMSDGELTANDWLGKEAADVVARRQASV